MTRFLTSPDRYIKHPPVTDSDLSDGAPVDAATAMIVHNNLSVLSKRNVRLIGHDPGRGRIVGYSWSEKGSSPFSPYFDAEVPAFPITDDWDRIPWTIDNCTVFGPYNGVAKRLSVAPPGYVLRKVRVHVRGFNGVAAANKRFWIGVAITQGRPLNGPRGMAASIVARNVYSHDNSGPVIFSTTIDIDPTSPIRPNADWIARAGDSGGPTTVRVPGLYVWVGWWSNNEDTGQPEYVSSISAFEVYE